MKKLIVLSLFTSMLFSCGEECYNAPQPIVFEFVNDNNENLITNGSLSPYSVQDEQQQPVALTKTADDRIVLENVGAYNGVKNYKFYSPLRVFDFSIESSEFKGGCDGFQINKLSFKGIAIDVEDKNGYYRIIIK